MSSKGGTAEHELKANTTWHSRYVADRSISDDPGSFWVISEACLTRTRPAEAGQQVTDTERRRLPPTISDNF